VIPDDVRELFAARNYAHLATIGPKGPTSVPVWIDVDGDRLVFFTQSGSRKAKNIADDPRVALSIIDRHDPYRQADVRGRVVERLDGDAALAAIAARLPDVVLLDLRLPGTDGPSVLDRLAADEELRDIPVVVLTAYGEDLTGAASQGHAAIVLHKAETPIDMLPELLRSVLRRHRRADGEGGG
jgi:PPOX class probable F420-dependent enzyme